MKKEGAILIAFLLILSSGLIVIAQEDEKIDKAYGCLEDKVEDRCDDLSVEEQAFIGLAIGECSSELKDNSRYDECWPESGCRLRDTALAVLAFDRVGRSTSEAEDWLLDQTKDAPLTWYLEIDSDKETDCEINGKTITIGEDKKISGSAPSGLKKAYDDYWFEIININKNFTISCNEDFKTTLLYEKDSTIYVSSKTNSASANGETEERVNAFCFEQGNSCNYEGSLWATLALAKTGNDVSSFLPYLIAMADESENKEFFPSTFLYIITDYDEYFIQIIDKQKSDYWKEGNNRYYDTALALLALYGLDAEQANNAKDYLLEHQDPSGCWNNDNKRDTAFILYAAYPRSVSAIGGDMDDCEDYNYYCASPLDCAQNEVLDNYVCYGGKVCCETRPAEKTCDEKGGIECGEDQECTGAIVASSDITECCKGSCITKVEEPECEKENFICRYSCFDDEEQKLFDCDGEKICCAPESVREGGYGWIWILVILIILIVVAIIFRNRLRIWLSRIKGKFGKGPAQRRPGFPPAPAGRGMPGARPRMMMPRQPMVRRQGPVRRILSKTDRELEDTFKKLREMSK